MAKHLRGFYKENRNTICVIHILSEIKLVRRCSTGTFKGGEVQILKLSVVFKVLFAQESKIHSISKVMVVYEQLWRGSSRGGGDGV